MAPAVTVVSQDCTDTLATDSLYTGSNVWLFAKSLRKDRSQAFSYMAVETCEEQ